MVKVSIIIPVYNTEHFLKRCIDSILAQTYSDWELVLVDDGSKDSSGKICDEYAHLDNRIIVIHKSNGGVSSARNVGLDIAKGEYVCFMDSDDWVEPSYLEDFHIDEIKSDFYVSGASYDVYEKVYSQLKYKQRFCENAQEIKQQFIVQHLDENGYPWGKIYRLEVIRENNLRFNEALSINEDHIFIFQYYSYIKDLYIISSCKYHYICFDNSGRKLSDRFNTFNAIKLSSTLFDNFINVLNERWSFDVSTLSNLKNKYVYQRRLVGIPALIKERKLYLINQEREYWKNNSYRAQTKMGKIVLSLLRGETSSSIIYMHLFILYKIKSFIPRNKEKAIYADLLKRSTLVES